MIHTAYSSIHTHVSSLPGYVQDNHCYSGLCMIHTAYSSIHTHVSSLIPHQDNHGATQGYV